MIEKQHRAGRSWKWKINSLVCARLTFSHITTNKFWAKKSLFGRFLHPIWFEILSESRFNDLKLVKFLYRDWICRLVKNAITILCDSSYLKYMYQSNTVHRLRISMTFRHFESYVFKINAIVEAITVVFIVALRVLTIKNKYVVIIKVCRSTLNVYMNVCSNIQTFIAQWNLYLILFYIFYLIVTNCQRWMFYFHFTSNHSLRMKNIIWNIQ